MNLKSIACLSLLTLSVFSISAFGEEIDISKLPTSIIPKTEDLNWANQWAGSPTWFTPVLVKDEFEGNYVAVFDKHWEHPMDNGISEKGIISNWFPKAIRVYSYVINTRGIFVKEAVGVTVKIGNKAYPLVGKQGNFKITSELAYALKTAPLEVTKIKTAFADNGISTVSNIDQKTVAAWKVVYRAAKNPG